MSESSGASDYLERSTLEHFFGVADHKPPTELSISLHEDDPGEDNSGNNELTEPGYEKVVIKNLPDNVAIGVDEEGYSLSFGVPVTFEATSDWGQPPLWAACTNDNNEMLYCVKLEDTETGGELPPLKQGQILEFTSENFKFKME
jgi:hypothetical protein